jgi:type I restriction enzyme, S subunit
VTWAKTRLKYVAKIGYGLGQPPELSDSGIPILRATNIMRGKFTSDGLIFAAIEDLPLDRAPLLREGEILVVRSGAYTGDSAIVTTPWAGSAPGYDLRVSPTGANAGYLAYCMLSKPVLDQIALAKARAAQPHLNAEDLGDATIDLPSFDEQRRISEFLDSEITRIDSLISAQVQALNLLEERANSRIIEVIGRSRLVEDGGEAVTQLRRVVKKVARPIAPTGEVITAFRDGQVTARSSRRSEGYTVSANLEPQGQGVETGDIVIHGLDGFAGAIGDSEASGNCSPVYHVCLPIDGGNSTFYGRLLKLLALDDYLALYGASARERAVDFRNWKVFGRAPVPQVEPSIQHEIGDMITKIRPLREEIRRFNKRLVERRQALITAAVTGGITV